MQIHKTAIIDKEAQIGANVRVDAYSIIGKGSVIGEGTQIGSNVEICPHTEIGKNNIILKGAYIGGAPQDASHKSSSLKRPGLKIGDNNIIREYVTIHHGTRSSTIIGSSNFLMAHSHVAHDCVIGNHVSLANYAGLGGFVNVSDYVFISAHSLVHQHTRIGKLSMIGALAMINQDIPPYSLVASSSYGKLGGLNIRGIKRHLDFDEERELTLKRAFRYILRGGYNLSKSIDDIELRKDEFSCVRPEVMELIGFIRASVRGITRKWR